MKARQNQKIDEFMQSTKLPVTRDALIELWELSREELIEYYLSNGQLSKQQREYFEARIKKLEAEVKYYKPAANYLNN